MATYLSQYQMVPYQRLQELFRDLLHAPLSQGTLNNILHRGYQHLESIEEEAKRIVGNSNLAHFEVLRAHVKINSHPQSPNHPAQQCCSSLK
jgi:hypothetical protein